MSPHPFPPTTHARLEYKRGGAGGMGINIRNIKALAAEHDFDDTPGVRMAVDATDLHKKLEPLALYNDYHYSGDADIADIGGHDPRVEESKHRTIMHAIDAGASPSPAQPSPPRHP